MDLASTHRTLVSTLALSGLLSLPAPARADFLYGRLVPAVGIEPNGISTAVDVSSNGRTVVFSTDATNWGAGESYNGDRAVAVDLDTGVIDIVSRTPTGTIFRGETPAVSGDGRYVAFLTHNTGQLGQGWQVARKDRRTGALELASANAAGQAASTGTNDDSVSISASGRYVAFDTAAPNFVSPGSGTQIFVKDMQTGAVEMASVRSDGSPAGSDGNLPAGDASGNSPAGGGACRLVPHALSDDGRYLTMACNTEMVPGAGTGQIYVRDLQADTTELVSRVGAGGPASSTIAYRPAISPNGRFVSFQNRGFGGLGYANGVDSTGNSGVYLRDRQTQATIPVPRPTLVSVDNYDSCNVSAVSNIGSVILSCPLPIGAFPYPQVFLYVPGAGAPELVSIGIGNQPGNLPSGYSMAVNGSGLSMVFESTASNIDPADTNGKSDIFILAEESMFADVIFTSSFE